MELEEKMVHFETETKKKTEEALQNQLDQYEDTLKQDYDQFVHNTDATMKERFQEESEALRKEANKKYSEVQIERQRDLYLQQTKLKEIMLNRFKQALEDYKQTEEYVKQLEHMGQTVQQFAKNEVYDLYIDPQDEALVPTLEKALDHPVTVSDRRFYGGMRGVLRERDVLLDFSFATYLEQLEANWALTGGTK
ncbi:MAG: hypothetical protein Q4A55_04145 [Aerococcus sp.]|nr:hypothetical protein [Aerococcus sp.]